MLFKVQSFFFIHSGTGDSPAFLTEKILALMILQIVTGPLDVQKHGIGSGDISLVNLTDFSFGSQQGTGGNELNCIPEGSLHAY